MTENPIKSPFSPLELYNQVSYEQWRETALKSLKGEGFEVLEKVSTDKIALHPLYTKADVENTAILAPKPEHGYGVWDIRQRILVDDEKSANAIALEELTGGVNSVEFEIIKENVDFPTLIKDIKTDIATISIIGYERGLEFANLLINSTAAVQKSNALYNFNLNPNGLKTMGIDAYSLDEAFDFYKVNIGALPKANYFLASSNWLMEIGASRALQVAILIAAGIEYLRAGEAKGFEIAAINKALLFKIGIDGQVILEIAKLRAARQLWAKVTAAIGETLPMNLQAIVSGAMLEDQYPHTNILRIANACFAAGTGGANIVSTRSFDPDPEKENEFTRRVARNTQIVLANESNIARVNDPAAGAYAFETMTNQIAQAAWSMVQEIEAAGGLEAATKKGIIGDLMNAEHEDEA